MGSTNWLRHRRDGIGGSPGLVRRRRYLRAATLQVNREQDHVAAGGCQWIPPPPRPMDQATLSGQPRRCWRTGPGATLCHSDCTATRPSGRRPMQQSDARDSVFDLGEWAWSVWYLSTSDAARLGLSTAPPGVEEPFGSGLLGRAESKTGPTSGNRRHLRGRSGVRDGESPTRAEPVAGRQRSGQRPRAAECDCSGSRSRGL
jgi:hypothetical protein